MDFEWDPAKREANLAKHGVDFEDAVGIFDGAVLERVDDREEYGEIRMIAYGEVGSVVLAVVYVDGEETRRIISARKAVRHERRDYHAALAERAAKG